MMNNTFLYKAFLPVFVLISYFYIIFASPTFVISFQENGAWSTEEWVEFDKPIPILNEFTTCIWEKIRYFSFDFMPLWAYCIAYRNKPNDLNCTQLYSKGNAKTKNQQIEIHAWINGGEVIFQADIHDYRHRSWNHICWSYSSLAKTSKFYFNGNVVATRKISNSPSIPTEDEKRMTLFINDLSVTKSTNFYGNQQFL